MGISKAELKVPEWMELVCTTITDLSTPYLDCHLPSAQKSAKISGCVKDFTLLRFYLSHMYSLSQVYYAVFDVELVKKAYEALGCTSYISHASSWEGCVVGKVSAGVVV